jgi:prephenate dehydrogenase
MNPVVITGLGGLGRWQMESLSENVLRLCGMNTCPAAGACPYPLANRKRHIISAG